MWNTQVYSVDPIGIWLSKSLLFRGRTGTPLTVRRYKVANAVRYKVLLWLGGEAGAEKDGHQECIMAKNVYTPFTSTSLLGME